MHHPVFKPRGSVVRGSVAVCVVVAAAVTGIAAQSASAIPTDPTDNPCMSGSSFDLTASRGSVVWGESVVLSTTENIAAGCQVASFIDFTDAQSGVTYNEPFSVADKLIPPATGRYDLVIVSNGAVYTEGSVNVQVTSFPVVSGHPFARITPNVPDQAATFEQAVQQPGAEVFVQGDVNLDVSGMTGIQVAPGVQIIGERDASHPNGPRLFTTTYPRQLLQVGAQGAHADNVRITGIRFDGMEPPDPCDSAGNDFLDSDAVDIYASVGVQVDHDEFFAWRGSGVNVQDSDQVPTDPPTDRLNPLTGQAGVWIHDNYIHDNQHPTVCSDVDPFAGDGHGAGYGVNDSHGGFSYIQGNVFGDNRHSIAGGGENGSGYILTGNMFFNPGVDDVKVVTNYNHLIDMHGTQNCPGAVFRGESYNCGQGGLYMEVANNTVVSQPSNPAAAIQLRGQPTNVVTPTPGVPNDYGMYVHDNKFNMPEGQALTETQDDNGLVLGSGNEFVNDLTSEAQFADLFTDPSSQGPYCDFDGDGTVDAFRDSAGVLWYFSSRTGRWTYMTMNSESSGDLTLRDVNGDGLCDVSDGAGVVYQAPPAFESFPLLTTVPPLIGFDRGTAEDRIAAAGLKLDTVTSVPSLLPVGTVLGQSVPANDSEQAGSLVALTVSAGGVLLPNLVGQSESAARGALAAAGLVAGTVTRDVNPRPAGTVDAQSPAVGPTGATVVLPGSTVDFGVSLGQTTVPNIMGDTDAQARSAIASAGLSVGTVSSTDNCVDTGTVQNQNPVSGFRAAAGSPVNYTLSTCSDGGGSGGTGGAAGGSGGNGGTILPK